MNHTYYLGVYNNDTSLFNKNIGKERWEKYKDGKSFIVNRTELRYFTVDRCFILNKKNGNVYTEKCINMDLKSPTEFLVESARHELPFFPTQYNYFNKQIHTIDEYKDSNGNNICFSKYVENGLDYYEIYSSSPFSSSL
jgi:hypothetical protein